MKTTIIVLLSMILISGSALAGSPKPKKISLDKLLKKEITYPDFAKKQKLNGVVLVSFTVNSDGRLNINLTNESDASLKDYVISKLKSLKVNPGTESTVKDYNVKFEFKYEK